MTNEQKEHREKWVKALRSGQYAQTQQVLHNKQGFCCLGVACDLYRDHNTAFIWGSGDDYCRPFEGTIEDFRVVTEVLPPPEDNPSDSRLRALMQNIIDNNGKFTPEKLPGVGN